MSSSALVGAVDYTLDAATSPAPLPQLAPAPDDALPFVRGMVALVACGDLQEIAIQSARLLKELFSTSDVFVVLRGAEKDYRGVGDETSPDLEAWADEVLSLGPPAVAKRDERTLAARIGTPGKALRGLVAVALPEPELGDAQLHSLEAVASLIAQCCTRLPDIRGAMARGLHDLCTPLNSLRLGLQLLEPALSNQDPAIAQRVHRAIDRMAKLVEEMFAQLEPG